MSRVQPVADPAPSFMKRWLSRLRRSLLRRAWYVHTPVILMVCATPQTCIETLKTVARPSTSRLHYRNLFAGGRRYHIQNRRAGFRMTTTNSRRFRYRKRTSPTAVMWGTFADVDEKFIRLTLQSRVNMSFLMDTFLVPLGLGVLMAYTPWQPTLIATCFLLMLLFSWAAHRSQVVLEASEMIWFVQRALDELAPSNVMALEPGTREDVIYDQRAFEAAWERFYHDQTSLEDRL
jgi:hypothetical protein